MKKLADLLKNYGFYYDVEELKELKKNKQSIELTKKAYGDSREYTAEGYFGEDYPNLQALCEETSLEVDDYVWLD